MTFKALPVKISKIIATILMSKNPDSMRLSNKWQVILESLFKQTVAQEPQVDIIALDSCDNIYGTSIQETTALHQKSLTPPRSQPMWTKLSFLNTQDMMHWTPQQGSIRNNK